MFFFIYFKLHLNYMQATDNPYFDNPEINCHSYKPIMSRLDRQLASFSLPSNSQKPLFMNYTQFGVTISLDKILNTINI